MFKSWWLCRRINVMCNCYVYNPQFCILCRFLNQSWSQIWQCLPCKLTLPNLLILECINWTLQNLLILEIKNSFDLRKLKLANQAIIELANFGIQTCQFLKIKLANFGNSNLPILESQTCQIYIPTLDITKLANFGNYRACQFWKFYKLTKFGLANLPILVTIKASSFETPNWNSIPQLKDTFATIKGHRIYATFGNIIKLLVIHFWSSSKSC